MKCDELKAYKGDVTIPVYGTIADAKVYLKEDVDETIAELKQKLESVQASMYADVVDAGGVQMSELKAYHCNEWHNEYTEFYIKSEADKVIAELKDKLQNVSELLKETREWLIESQKMHKRCADGAIKKIRHHKYKQCLAMAKLCNEKWLVHNFAEIPTKLGFYDKWEKRWLELAEKFKEAK